MNTTDPEVRMASVTLTRAALAAVAELSSRYDAEKVIVIDRHNLIGSWHGVTILRAGGRAYRAVHSSGRVESIGGLSAPDWQEELDNLESSTAGLVAEREAAILERERTLLAEAVKYAELATTDVGANAAPGVAITAGWRFGLGNVGDGSELGSAALRLQDRGLLTVDWRAGAFRVSPEQLEDARAALTALNA